MPKPRKPGKTTAEFAKVIGQEKQLQKIIKEQENGLKAVK